MINRIDKAVNAAFGGIFLLLSILIVCETLLRKIFNVSLQGIDELSGYALAVGACLSFSSALIGRSHMRIDLLYSKYPTWLRSGLNLVSMLTLTLFALFLVYVSWQVILETNEYGSTAPTAWGTPLIWPQSLWFAAIIIFAVLSLVLLLKALKRTVNKDFSSLNQELGPKGAMEEVHQELNDFQQRKQKNSHTKMDSVEMLREEP